MDGLLPAIFSKSDEIKRNLKGLLRDPREMLYSLGEDLQEGHKKNQAAYQAVFGGKGTAEEKQAALERAASVAADLFTGGGGFMGNLAAPKWLLGKGAKTLRLPEAGGKAGEEPYEFGVLPTVGERFNLAALPQPGKFVERRLGEVFHNPSLHEIDPKAQDIPLLLRNVTGLTDSNRDPLGSSGVFDPKGDTIGVDFRSVQGPKGLFGILDHELGHYIGKREGVSAGSSPGHERDLIDSLFLERALQEKTGRPHTGVDKFLLSKLLEVRLAELKAGVNPGTYLYETNPGEVAARAGQHLRLGPGSTLPESELRLDYPPHLVREMHTLDQARRKASLIPNEEELIGLLRAFSP